MLTIVTAVSYTHLDVYKRQASPTVTLKEYIPADKERIYVVCNLTNRSSAAGAGDFLINKMASEEQLRNYTSQGMMKGFSALQSEGRTIPMYGMELAKKNR